MEMQLLERGLEIKLKRQSDFPCSVAPPPPEDLLENIFWIKGNADLLDFVKSHAACMDYDYGDIIMQEDDAVDGIHIIVYGMIKLYGSLHGHIQHLRLGAGSHTPLPITQSDGTTKKQEEEEDFLGSGNIVGEIGLLTKCNRTCTITCETAVQTYFLSSEDMEVAFEKFPELKLTMWKVVAVRISAPLFLEHLEYQGFGVEQIHLHLSPGYIVELTHANPLFQFTESIIEISLIYGKVKSPMSEAEIEAPFLLLPEHKQLQIVDCEFAILLVVPREEVTLEGVASSVGVRHRPTRLPSITAPPAFVGQKLNKVVPIPEIVEGEV
uniref:Cyclic nucleotide-binding domain-containing protein n=1 Tax=Ciona savignyi TaxID=51511 RepID=H2Z710_CIOSA